MVPNLNTDIATSLLVRWRLRDHVPPGATFPSRDIVVLPGLAFHASPGRMSGAARRAGTGSADLLPLAQPDPASATVEGSNLARRLIMRTLMPDRHALRAAVRGDRS
jgi:hypothetical protein